MKRSEVYSRRMTPDLKAALETQARRQGGSVGSLLERIVTEWLSERPRTADEQARLHSARRRPSGRLPTATAAARRQFGQQSNAARPRGRIDTIATLTGLDPGDRRHEACVVRLTCAIR